MLCLKDYLTIPTSILLFLVSAMRKVIKGYNYSYKLKEIIRQFK